MNVSVIVATYGDLSWQALAEERAAPSARAENPYEIHLHHAFDEGLSASRNYAASVVRGEWLLFLDADDELALGYLDAMRATMRLWNLARPGDLRDNPLLLVPSVQYITAGWREEPPRVLNDGRPLHEINRAVIGTLVPRRLFLDVGGFPEEPIYEDFALWLKCERAGARLVDVPDAVYRAFRRVGSRNLGPSSVAKEVYGRLRHEHLAWLASGGHPTARGAA